MIEEIGLAIAGLLVGGTATHYFERSRARVIAVDALTRKRRVRTFVCHGGDRIVAHDREERFHTPPPNVAYTIDGEEDV